MNCQQVQDHLLTADAPDAVSSHLEGCADCRAFAAKVRRLDGAVRALPVPPGAGAARDAFLRQLQPAPEPAAPAWSSWLPRTSLRLPPRRGLRAAWPRLAVAASVLLCVGLGAWLLTAGGVKPASASEPVVDQLVEWNLALASAESPAERGRIFAEQKDTLQQAVERGKLPAEERDLARKLIDNGKWLATSAAAKGDDPIGEAERFGDVADLLLQRMNAAAERGDIKALQRFSRNYAVVSSRGVAAKLERAGVTPPKPAAKKRLQMMMQRDAELRDRLERLAAQSPEAARREIRRAMAAEARDRSPVTRPVGGLPRAKPKPPVSGPH